MKVTVAICTWNRSRLLARTLESFTSVRGPDDVDWELVVVNNNSTDDTEAVLDQFADRLPLRRLIELEQGLSNARNAAVAAASGEYIVWTDDDVKVRPQWIEAYVRSFRAHPDAVLFGGPVLPWFEEGPPEWLAEALGTPAVSVALAIRDFGDEEVPLHRARVPFGANMAFRTDRLAKHRFDPNLGRKGTGMLGADETTVIDAVLGNGGEGWWVPGATVEHYIPAQRQTLEFLRSFWYASGQTDALIYPTDGRFPILGIPLWLWREAIRGEVRYRIGRLLRPASRWTPDLRAAASAWGRIAAVREKLRCEDLVERSG